MQSVRWFAMLFLSVLMVWTSGRAAELARDGAGDQIQAAWDRLYEGREAAASEPDKAAESPLWYDHITLNVAGTYQYNAVDFSGDPTVSFIVDDGPAGVVTPTGLSFPQVFETSDHQFRGAGSLATHGLGHERVNTYFAAVLRHDLDGLTEGSPFQGFLDDHGGERVDLSNAFVELNGLAARGLPSSMSIRIGRQFIPDLHNGLLGSPVMDGARFAYLGEQTDIALFIGRWEPFFQDIAEILVAGGRFSHQFVSDPASDFALQPYMDYLYFRDTTHNEESYRAVFGLNTRWRGLDSEIDLNFVDGSPIALNLRANAALGKLSLYGHVRRRLSDDDFSYDIFLSASDLANRRRLVIGPQVRATEVSLNADYTLLSWLVVGAGFWINALDEQSEQTGFQADFREFSGRLEIVPPGSIGGAIQYRYRDVDRGANRNLIFFDDASRTGETAYHEVNAELRYRWQKRLRVLIGGYYGIFDTQSPFRNVDDSEIIGAYARTRIRVSQALRLHFLLGIDKGNEVFNPDIDFQYTAQAGIHLYY